MKACSGCSGLGNCNTGVQKHGSLTLYDAGMKSLDSRDICYLNIFTFFLERLLKVQSLISVCRKALHCSKYAMSRQTLNAGMVVKGTSILYVFVCFCFAVIVITHSRPPPSYMS